MCRPQPLAHLPQQFLLQGLPSQKPPPSNRWVVRRENDWASGNTHAPANRSARTPPPRFPQTAVARDRRGRPVGAGRPSSSRDRSLPRNRLEVGAPRPAEQGSPNTKSIIRPLSFPLEVQVEVTPEVFSDTVDGMEQLQARLTHSIVSITGLHADVRLVAPRTLQRSEGKARRVQDKRKI